jgi:hypothetical protein
MLAADVDMGHDTAMFAVESSRLPETSWRWVAARATPPRESVRSATPTMTSER